MEDPLVQDAAQEAAAAATEARFTMNKVTTWTSIVNLFWGVLICVCGFAGFIIVQTHWSFNLEGQSIPLPLKTEYSNTNIALDPQNHVLTTLDSLIIVAGGLVLLSSLMAAVAARSGNQGNATQCWPSGLPTSPFIILGTTITLGFLLVAVVFPATVASIGEDAGFPKGYEDAEKGATAFLVLSILTTFGLSVMGCTSCFYSSREQPNPVYIIGKAPEPQAQ
eukprot:CAMPEP_0175964680 /NCGR_PEP_ID=MMETSP0108-20121206/37680_1 /TAXON_ID=195067 ORGANISM="Goniomonas pacifica, Strain CCMP1869" /NCGR_SAMPLE_ID=MMETSP0108 /ASSEMBLY_ACC=CAM_ASM_000204 /LENGTH=221 /DNA_ID=CAMNT_0017292657 /DNA_START=32 /DNA_END=698 /DNA_ORIENTATION=-